MPTTGPTTRPIIGLPAGAMPIVSGRADLHWISALLRHGGFKSAGNVLSDTGFDSAVTIEKQCEAGAASARGPQGDVNGRRMDTVVTGVSIRRLNLASMVRFMPTLEGRTEHAKPLS